MKRIIDGKSYNTETAYLIAEWDNGLFYNDFYHCSEELYQTVKENWFLYGSGGAASKYSTTSGNSSSGSCAIIPLTAIQALKWLEQKEFTDEIEEHFPNEIEEA